MKQNLDNEKQSVSYLLGEMSEADRDWFEERLFTDEDLSLLLDDAENNLIDEYLRGELDASQKQKFEKNYLISERRREKLCAAEILQKEVFAEKSVFVVEPISFRQKLKEKFAFPRLILAGSLAAAALFVLVGGLWFVRQNKNGEIVTISNENQNVSIEMVNQLSVNQNLRNSNLQSNTEQKPANESEKKDTNLTLPQNNNRQPANIEENKESTPQPPAPSQIPQKKQIFAFTFLPGLRGSEKPVLIVPPNAEIIRLRVVHNNLQEFTKYRAEIRASDGDLIWSREININSKNLSKPLTLDVRSGALNSGSYELTLSGATSEGQLEEINFYNFVVQRSKKE